MENENVKFEVTNEAQSIQQGDSPKPTTLSDRRTFYFELRDDLPVKIGDGSFGAVFAIKDSAGQPYALKIFYEVISSDQAVLRSARQRFKSEMSASGKIRSVLPTGAIDGLVLPIASTENFKKSAAFLNLKSFFQDINLSVSDFALVMERYDCTLKDLLESKSKPVSQATGDSLSGSAEFESSGVGSFISGYEILRAIRQDAKREQFITWVIRELIAGLKILHLAGLRHHDIKPANILLRLDLAGRLHVALGDLGFLHPDWTVDPNNGTLIQSNQDGLPLGTRHYRSVEQRDYFDVCDVTVNPSDEEYQLSTADPKFRDSLMEPGDVLVFSKDRGTSGSQLHEIAEIARGDGIVKIKLKPNHALKSDRRTQVNLFKKHTIRTDIFGIGALMYDMVTCGKSPERFYDFIRRWDRLILRGGQSNDASRSQQQFGISELEREYNQRYFTQSSGVSAEMSSVFDELRYDEKNYPSPRIVNIIFKSMLGRAIGSYVYGHIPTDHKGVEAIYAHIEKDLAELGPVDDMRIAAKNPVWQKVSSSTAGSAANVNDFSKRLSRVKEIWDPKERLAVGYVFLLPLCNFIFSAAKDSHQGYNASARDAQIPEEIAASNYPFYADMSPENLEEKPEGDNLMSVRVQILKNALEYTRALKDNSLGLITNSLRREYMPPYINGLVRSVYLREVGKSGEKCKVDIRFLDFSPVWFGVNVGDYLIYPVNGDTEVSEIRDLGNIEVPPSIAGSKAVLVKRLLPVEYYLATLAIYIHNSFFVDYDKDFGEVPETMQLLLKLSSMSEMTTKIARIVTKWDCASPGTIQRLVTDRRGLEQIRYNEQHLKLSEEKKWFGNPNKVAVTDGIDHCYKSLACMYVWLTGLNFRRSNPNRNASEYVPQIEQYWERLGRDIALACGYKDGVAQMRLAIKNRLQLAPNATRTVNASGIPSLSVLVGELFLT